MEILWTDYMKHRVRLRGFEPATIEHIVQFTSERYIDTVTGRLIAVGRHNKVLVIIPYEAEAGTVIPITVHATTRQQINLRLKSGRFIYE